MLAKQSFEDKCVPKLELGNEGHAGALELGNGGAPEASTLVGRLCQTASKT